MCEAGVFELALIQIGKHQLQIARRAERAHHMFDRIPALTVFDIGGARCKLALQEVADFGAEGPVRIV
ncbi:hypothetical protein BTHE68_59630 (plasmid) [Burkholderia sp. THE68]|nr:hypothetical protein BTHE68_59630 [Burkholderia sp. THE68]